MTAKPQLYFAPDGSIVSVSDSPLFSGIPDADTGEGMTAFTARFYSALSPTDRDTLRAFCAAAVSDDPAENELLLSLRPFYFFRAAFFEKATDGTIRATLYTSTAELYAKTSPYAHRILPLLDTALSAIPEWRDALQREPESVFAETSPFVPLYGNDGICAADAPCRTDLTALFDWFGKTIGDEPLYRDVPLSLLLPPPDARDEYTVRLAVKPFVYLLFALHLYLYRIADADFALYGTLTRRGGEITISFRAKSAQIPDVLWLRDSITPLVDATPRHRSLLYYIQYLLHTHTLPFSAEAVEGGLCFSFTVDCGTEDWETLDFKYSEPLCRAAALLPEVRRTLAAIPEEQEKAD